MSDNAAVMTNRGFVLPGRLTIQQPYATRKAYFRNFAQAVYYMRRAKAYFDEEVGKFGPREKQVAKQLARILCPYKVLGSHEVDEWYWASATENGRDEENYLGEKYREANALLALYHGVESVDYYGVGRGRWSFYSGASAQPYNLKPYRTGWIRRRWFCDCLPCTTDEECPHVCWWPGYGPGQFPRVLRPLTRREGVEKSLFGCLPNDITTHDPTDEELEYFIAFREHFFKLADSGMRMERNHLVRPDKGYQLHREEGRRYEVPERVRANWLTYDEEDYVPESCYDTPSHPLEPPRPVIMALYLAEVVRARPVRRGPTLDLLKMRKAVLRDLRETTSAVRNIKDEEYQSICFPGDPATTVPFETLVRDYSLPHALKNDSQAVALYTRYYICPTTTTFSAHATIYEIEAFLRTFHVAYSRAMRNMCLRFNGWSFNGFSCVFYHNY